MPRTVPILSSNRPDASILRVLARFQRFALTAIALTSGTTFVAWLVPALAGLLPAGWHQMKCNSALLSMLAAAGIFLSRPRQSAAAVRTARILGWFIAGIGALTFIERNSTISFHIDTVIAADRFASAPGRMSGENALAFLLIGFLVANIRTRKNRFAPIVDVATVLLCTILLLQISGFIMQHLRLIDVPPAHAMSAPGALCFGLLGVLIFNRRMEYNCFAILLGTGIAGRVARIAVPMVVSIPFAVDSTQAFLIAHVDANRQFLTGVGATLLSATSLCLVIVLCRQINDLENHVRELSLRDELTGLYNRRGFYFLAEQALLSARRSGDSLSICYFDVDGLKHINDTQGHDAGSELLREMAQLMKDTFRESDILGRIGGDEFVAACKGDTPPVWRLAEALSGAVQRANRTSDRTYTLSYSVGLARCEPDSDEPLERLIQRADHAMYSIKRAAKRRQPLLQP